MKKTIGILLVIILSVSVVCFAACNDTSDLNDRIAGIESSLSELTNKVDGINNPSASEIQSIKDDIASLKIAVGLLDPSSTDFDALLRRIDELESKLTDYDELITRISTLEQTIAGNKQLAEQQISSLTTRVSTLEASLSAAETEIALLKTQVLTLSGTVTTLSQTVQTLKELCESESSGNTALMAQIDALVSDISELEGSIATLNSTVSSLTDRVGMLETDLTAAKLEIDAIKGAINYETTTLEMGDVFTFKSASGLELFRVRLLGYSDSYQLQYNIQNISLPSYVSLNRYFTVCLYSETLDAYRYKTTTLSTNADNSFDRTYGTLFGGGSIGSENVTHFVIGIGTDNDISETTDRQYIIPYAIYTYDHLRDHII